MERERVSDSQASLSLDTSVLTCTRRSEFPLNDTVFISKALTLDPRQLNHTKTVPGGGGRSHQSNGCRGTLREDSGSAEGKTKFFRDRRKQGGNNPVVCKPSGSGRGTGSGWQAFEGKAACLCSLHAWAHGQGGRSCQTGINGHSRELETMRAFLRAHMTKGNQARRTVFPQGRGSQRFHEESILVITTPGTPWGLEHLISISVNPGCDGGHTHTRHLGNSFQRMKDPREQTAWGEIIRKNFSLVFCPNYSSLDIRLN